MAEKQPTIIQIRLTGDPFGKGFVGLQSNDGGTSWHYRGDIGERPRWWWRRYARSIGARLREN